MQHTNISGAPYFDDYDPSKDFHRILFKPRPVQARELNQMQSIMMSQVERLGNHLFTEGAMVIPGGIKIIPDQSFAALTFNGQSVISDIVGLDNLTIQSNTSGLIANISKIMPATGSDPITLFIDYTNSGSAQEKTFAISEQCAIYQTVGTVVTNIANVTITNFGKGVWAKVQNGVYFTRGIFVENADQDFVVSKYSVTPTIKIGFEVVEEIIDVTKDSSLYSNAVGYPNFQAPGADRLKISLNLIGLDPSITDTNFIELARIVNGVLQTKVDSTDYSVIEKAIAQRTYETNGDYAVNMFGLDIKEHLNNGTNGGVYLAADGGLESRLVAAIKPGIGYIKGYRVENIAVANLSMDKARDTTVLQNSVTSSDYGPYVLATNLYSMLDIDIKKRITLFDSIGNNIGYCRIRAIRRDGANVRLYIFDVNISNPAKTFSNVAKLKYTDSTNLFTCDLVSSVMYGSSNSTLFFKLPVDAVQSLLTAGVSDTSYTVLRSFTVNTNGVGLATISAGLNESFDVIDGNNYFIADTGAASPGQQYDPVATTVLSGSPVGSSITINLGSGNPNKSIRVVAPIIKLVGIQKTKTLTTVTNESLVFNNQTTIGLQNSDIVSIISIIDPATSEDVTAAFSADNGQRPGWYQAGQLTTTNGTAITRTLNVTYQYFAHSTGDYFSVDSYGGLNRSSIPTINGVSLADCVDFRPSKTASGDIDSSVGNGEIVKPAGTIRSDISYYISRRDAIYVDSTGSFGIVKGIPGLIPTAPTVPDNSMKLYDLFVPAYTSAPTDVQISYIDNKRYTMRDIGKLETRIGNLEYYTTLSQLESKANSTQIFDPITGNNRFKNGFAVDGFTDFSLADLNAVDWSASIDPSAGALKPQFMENGTDYTVTSNSSDIVKPKKVYMKTYTSLAAIVQPYATTTINVNPFAVYTWAGIVDLLPTTDFWKDVKYVAPVIINNTNNLRGNQVEGTIWNTWVGLATVSVTGGSKQMVLGQLINVTAGQVTTTSQTTTTTATTTSFGSSTSSTQTDNFLNNVVIPYMRSIDIQFTCQRFKPFTRLYPFWDGTAVSAQCKPIGGSYGQALVTDASGSVVGIFTVPNTDALKFKTGTSAFRFTDSPTDSRGINDFSSSGQTSFTSGGSVDSRQITVVNTTTLTATTSTSTTSNTTTSSVTTPTPPPDTTVWSQPDFGGGGGGSEPIAQTFRVPLPGGSFISKVDLFFATKAASIPVMLQLRTVQTGFPTDFVLAQKVLTPNLVNSSVDGSAATTFTFDDPVYLEENVEYAMVVLADTQEYTVYIAELGGVVIGQQMALAKQANLGVFFTSSNGTTWDANQTADMKFTMYRAVFNPSANAQITFNGVDPIALPLNFNAITTANGSNLISVYMKSHGLHIGDNVTLSGVVSGNNINAALFNGIAKSVVSVDIDHFVINSGSSANATGTIGGSAILCKANYPFTTFLSNISSVNFNYTSLSWEYMYRDQATRTFSAWTSFQPKKSYNLPREAVMIAGSDFQIRATLKTTVDNLSPVIDSSGFTSVFVSPRINNSFTAPVFAYVTQNILFDNPSTSATFYVGALLPNGSSMKLYYKTFDTADQDISTKVWTELVAKTPIVNDMNNPFEYTYQLSNVGSFVGYKVKIVMVGTDPVSYPILSDFRSIALA